MKTSSTTHQSISSSSSRRHQPLPQPRTSVPFFYTSILSATMGPLADDDDDSLLFQNIPWERPRDYDQDMHRRRPNSQMNPSVDANTLKSLAPITSPGLCTASVGSGTRRRWKNYPPPTAFQFQFHHHHHHRIIR
mmetsp:Transcript_17733/g.20095  ORF Transcript_17733/g.20095 Transcript_17733/m.20095 type:complete len:135 (-) Transcript_17733:24-428(-)